MGILKRLLSELNHAYIICYRPNGIGKTTTSYDIVPANIPIINSDEIAKEVRRAGLLSVNAQEYSNREAIRLMDEQLARRNSFAIETNLADVDTWKFLLEVQKSGYLIHILYMSTDNLEVLNSRIHERTLLGDHFVKPEIVEERYIAGLGDIDAVRRAYKRLKQKSKTEQY